MYKSLYEIQEDYSRIISDLMDAEGELTPEMEFALAINRDELENKAEAYALRIFEFDGEALLLKAEIDRLTKRQKAKEATSERLKETIKAAMLQFNVDKIKTNKVTLSFRKSEKVEVPETFAENILQYTKLELAPDEKKIAATAKDDNDFEKIKDHVTSMVSYFKVSASVDTAKIKSSLKEGTTVGDVMLLTNKNLQIK